MTCFINMQGTYNSYNFVGSWVLFDDGELIDSSLRHSVETTKRKLHV